MPPLYDPDDDLDHRRPHVPRLLRPLLTHQDRTLLPLVWTNERWIAEVDTYFRPMGLLVVNAPRRGGVVAEWRNGSQLFLPPGRGPISLDVFSHIETLGPDAPCRPSFPTLSPGHRMSLCVLDVDGKPFGPPLELTVWGLSIRSF